MPNALLMPVLRIAAAALLAAAPAILTPQPLLAGGEEGGCLEEPNHGCITKTAAYEDKFCYSGNCLTCTPEDDAVCTWCDHDVGDTFNPADPPCGNN